MMDMSCVFRIYMRNAVEYKYTDTEEHCSDRDKRLLTFLLVDFMFKVTSCSVGVDCRNARSTNPFIWITAYD